MIASEGSVATLTATRIRIQATARVPIYSALALLLATKTRPGNEGAWDECGSYGHENRLEPMIGIPNPNDVAELPPNQTKVLIFDLLVGFQIGKIALVGRVGIVFHN